MQGVTTDYLVIGVLGFLFLCGVLLKLLQPRDSFKPEREEQEAKRARIGVRETVVAVSIIAAVGGALYLFRGVLLPGARAQTQTAAQVAAKPAQAIAQSQATATRTLKPSVTIAPSPTTAATATQRPTVTPWPTSTVAPTEAPTEIPSATPTEEVIATVAVEIAQRELAQGELFAVARSELEVRDGPGDRFRIVGSIPADARVILVGRLRQLTWVKLEHADASGWVQLSAIAPDGLINRVRIVAVPR